MSTNKTKIVLLAFVLLFVGTAFFSYANAQVIDPCSFGCPKEGCPCPEPSTSSDGK